MLMAHQDHGMVMSLYESIAYRAVRPYDENLVVSALRHLHPGPVG